MSPTYPALLCLKHAPLNDLFLVPNLHFNLREHLINGRTVFWLRYSPLFAFAEAKRRRSVMVRIDRDVFSRCSLQYNRRIFSGRRRKEKSKTQRYLR